MYALPARWLGPFFDACKNILYCAVHCNGCTTVPQECMIVFSFTMVCQAFGLQWGLGLGQ